MAAFSVFPAKTEELPSIAETNVVTLPEMSNKESQDAPRSAIEPIEELVIDEYITPIMGLQTFAQPEEL